MPSAPLKELNKQPCYCNKCGITKAGDNFYTYKDGTKMEICKNCLTAHVDNFDPSTYEWILEKLDYAYVPQFWNEIRDNAIRKSPNKPLSTVAVLGRYISRMKLKQYKDYGYARSAELLEKLERENRAAMRDVNISFGGGSRDELEKMYQAGEISEAEYKTFSSPESATDARFYSPPPLETTNPYANYMKNTQDEFEDELTDENRRYLSIKWGRNYKPSEWVRLEENYKQMEESFDIRDADTITTLKFLCKTNLKMNEAIDLGDAETFQKLSRVYDNLRKSAKFTASQNKEQSNDSVDSVGELVAMCEKEGGFIPRFCLDVPQDKLDATIKDMKKYTYDLVTGEMGLGKMIEEAIQQIQLQQQEDEKDIMDYEEEVLNDADFQDYFDSIEEEEGSEEDGSM